MIFCQSALLWRSQYASMAKPVRFYGEAMGVAKPGLAPSATPTSQNAILFALAKPVRFYGFAIGECC
mgnify:CR=1 FL=1